MPNNILLSAKITSLVKLNGAKRSLQTLFDLPACIKHNHSPQNLCPTFGIEIDLLIDLIFFFGSNVVTLSNNAPRIPVFLISC